MYTHVFIGGTFDKLHAGHKATLKRAFDEGETVTVGLTSDAFIQNFKQNGEETGPFEDRKRILGAYLEEQRWGSRSAIIAIDDPYEPAASGDFSALIVTADNRSTGDDINRRRAEKGLSELVLLEAPIVSAEDGEPVSSSRVRNGEIDEEGHLMMPEDMRSLLGKPMGKVLISDEEVLKSFAVHKNVHIVTVGDISTKRAMDAGYKPKLAILDYKVARKPYEELKGYDFTGFQIEQMKSGPGFISKHAHSLIEKWAQNPYPLVIIVDGEEDLLTLPAVAFAPEGSVIYYGQPGEGLVEVMTAEGYQKKAQDILDRFEREHPDRTEGEANG